MEIEVEKGILDLDKESDINIERTNPLLNEQGSMSLPFSIKRTSKNDYLLNFPHKYERKNIFKIDKEANIRSGLLNENATLKILSVDAEKIESVFYLFESSFYNQVKEVKLTTVFDGVERWFQPYSVTREDRINYILDMLENMIVSPCNYSEDFTIFPAVINCEISPQALENGVGGTAVSQDVINEVYYDFEPEHDPVIKLKAKESYQYTDDNENLITIPAGYGVSPFLRFRYVLHKIFEYLGLTLEPSIFDTDISCRMWCVLNNTKDAVMNGYLKESQLVPDCTVNDFLDIIRTKLCCDFFINTVEKTARLVLFNDVLDKEPDMDLTPFLTDFFKKIEIATPKQVKLTINKSLPFAESATETIEEFRKKYPDYNPIIPHVIIADQGVFPDYVQNSIWKLSEPDPDWLWTTYKSDRLSSLNFDYVTSDEIEVEEHKIPAEALATIYFTTGSDHFQHLAPIIGSGRNLNSYIIIDGTKVVEDTVECPIMISLENFKAGAYRMGIQANDQGYMFINDPDFVPARILLWGENGLFEKYWKRYDNLCRTSFNPITYKFMLPAYLLQSFRFDRLKVINGQPLIAESMKYKPTDESLIDVEILFRTVKIYDDNSETPPVDPDEELKFFIGRWSMKQGTAIPNTFIASFDLSNNKSGNIYLSNNGEEINTTFSNISIKNITAEGITFKRLTLTTPNGELYINAVNLNEYENTFIIVWISENCSALLKKN